MTSWCEFCLCHETMKVRFGRYALTWDRRLLTWDRRLLTWDHGVIHVADEYMSHASVQERFLNNNKWCNNCIIYLNFSRMRCCKNEKRWKNDCMIVKMREYDAAWWDAWCVCECRGTYCMIGCMIVAGLTAWFVRECRGTYHNWFLSSRAIPQQL